MNIVYFDLTNLALFRYILKKAKYEKQNSSHNIIIVLTNNLLHYKNRGIKLQTMAPDIVDKKY